MTIAPATANLARGEAAKRIVELAPEGFSKVFFTNAGADANENAIRMARLYTGRDKVLSGLSFIPRQYRQRDCRHRRLAPRAE
ncbi:Ornithine/acetylornithine aminotransferase [Raoultella planticola]|uniref:Ornithine/acetylornithine aminotransferase n=1 Tax=Raoultella planticola TaxID=575 RepID=A0A485ALD5_RAOPL|nr:Ornithine/acetylornithine aminotransferase [Raoultella planticola]